jgi:WD40 repeat protein
MCRAIRVVGWGLVLLVIGSAAIFTRAAGDGIPDNCEYQNAPNYRPNLFPRYEPQNARLVLVDWATGADTTVLQTDLATDASWIIGWSPDCRYLVAAVGESRDFYIWDTVDDQQRGSLPHARHIDWSRDAAYALVQSDAGAYLWPMSSQTSIQLTTAYEPAIRRNFTSFRWQLNEGYLSADLVDGRDFNYDLHTGEALNVPVPSYYSEQSPSQTITLDGKTYSCPRWSSYRRPIANAPSFDIVLDYDKGNHRLVLDANRTPVRVVMENVTALRFVRKGWSANCRYFAFALGDYRVTDTYMWDAVNNRQVGIFEGANLTPHPVTWDPTGDYAVIESRFGGYLWNLANNTRTLLHEGSIDYGYSDIRSLTSLSWDEPRGQILAVPATADNTLEVYDMYTGQRLMVYDIGGRPGAIGYTVIDGTDWIVLATGTRTANAGGAMALWNRATNTSFQFQYMGEINWWYMRWRNIAISPDNHYFVYQRKHQLSVWDLQNPTADGSPNYRHTTTDDGDYIHFADATSVDFGSGLSRWDVVTGERIGMSPLVVPEGSAPVMTAALLNSPGDFSVSNTSCGIVDGINRRMPRLGYGGRFSLLDWKTGEEAVLLETGVTFARSLGWSPDCHYLVGYISNQAGRNTIIWDSNTGQRVQTLPIMYDPHWSPNNDQIIFIQGWRKAKLFNMQSGQLADLNDLGHPDFSQVYWDYGRGQILVSGEGGVTSYDMTSGALRQVYTRSETGKTRFVLSDDRTLMADFTHDGQSGTEYKDGLTIWNLNTLDNFQVNVQGWVGDVGISPDNHYLVIRGTVLRVWDLTNLPSEYDARLPIYRLPIAAGMKWAFEDDDSIAISTFRGEVIQHWDLRSGQQIEVS